MEEKISFFEVYREVGSSRYFLWFAASSIPKMSVMVALSSPDTLELNWTANFWGFINCPDQTSYYFRIFMKVMALAIEALPNNNVSSANIRWEKVDVFAPKLIPCSSPTTHAFLSKEISPSVQIMNKYGDRGSPCHSPLPGLKKPNWVLLTSTEYETEVT
ncbi:hypothetical protein LIER_39685 [Lithospermum erythrorhizon]|uniref:Uncharacterized protein n=1 Tax=Lithospermum erythrorhizon TaxID=34254 RepID=A0AAV3QIH2_LITER